MSSDLVQLTEHVWLLPLNAQQRLRPSVGVIRTAQHTVLVDTGFGPDDASRIQKSLVTLNAPAVSHIIYTHHHHDHVFGACVFAAPIIAHELCYKLLHELQKTWSVESLQRESTQDSHHAEWQRELLRSVKDWSQFRIMLPTITFPHALRMHLDDVTLELKHVGGKHSADSVTVHVKEDDVLFLGDCFYRSRHAGPDLDFLESLLNDHTRLYIDAHSEPRTRTQVVEMIARRQARQHIAN
jgi:glyoxylase-like metal-dependent hydrolase (beta-lactamase superfamily II)